MIIDFNKQNGGSADLSKYWTSAQTESAIEQATEDLVTSGEVQTMIDDSISGISIDLSDYWTSAQTESAIDEAISEIVIPDVSEFVTSADVKTQVEAYNYINSAETQTMIDASISGISIDLSDYWTSAQTQEHLDEINVHIDDFERVTSIGLNDLNDRVNELSGNSGNSGVSAEDFNTLSGIVQVNEEVVAQAINDLNSKKVSSTDISTIVKISQSDYDALVSGGTVDNSTFYIITGSTI